MSKINKKSFFDTGNIAIEIGKVQGNKWWCGFWWIKGLGDRRTTSLGTHVQLYYLRYTCGNIVCEPIHSEVSYAKKTSKGRNKIHLYSA